MPASNKKQAAKEKVVTTKAKEVAASKRAIPSEVLFISRQPEIHEFSIYVMGEEVRPTFCGEREYLTWSVPSHMAERFAMHEFVVQGRIIRGEG